MTGRAVLVATLLLACHPRPRDLPTETTHSIAESGPVCAAVPLSLELRNPASVWPPQAILALDAGGHVTFGALPTAGRSVTLTPDGCLVGDGALWAELAPADVLWTERESFAVSRSCLAVGGGAAVCIGPDGTVERQGADGGVEPVGPGSIALVGYRPEARCAGLVLLGAFMAMMPSMASSDGHPPRSPLPAGSRCARFTRH